MLQWYSQGAPFATNELRIEFATDQTRASVEVDAISLIGRPLNKRNNRIIIKLNNRDFEK